MKEIKIPSQLVRKLIDDLEGIIYCKREDPRKGILIYYPADVYSDEEATQITRDFLRVVARFCDELKAINYQPHIWWPDVVDGITICNFFKSAAFGLADMLEEKSNGKEN